MSLRLLLGARPPIGAVAARRRHNVLARAQELALIETMRDRFPDQLDLNAPLWKASTMSPLSPTAAARYLRAWGLSTREPVDRACPLCAESVVRWRQALELGRCRFGPRTASLLRFLGR
ncbi:hypothetical protein GCM10022251_42300 [Phytohabitans flavus]|uniref:Winged helix-turn helix domain-containing protein n=1 Tax=Phytohabitans flavus TaxID=1076124 RepID=A0A6F8Y0M2_9ACTN|nr:hypothetical protein Pflav_059310 [Phytohabitans flavus]